MEDRPRDCLVQARPAFPDLRPPLCYIPPGNLPSEER